MKKLISLISLICFFTACQKKQKCEESYNTFLDLKFESNYESALLSINNAIKCDSKNEDYRFEKIQLLILLNNYSEAKNELLRLGNINEIFLTKLPLYGAVQFKEGNLEDGERSLKKVYLKLSEINFSEDDFNLYYYKLLSQIFVISKDSVLKEIKNQKIYLKKNEKQSLSFLGNLIEKNNNRIDILYMALGIDN